MIIKVKIISAEQIRNMDEREIERSLFDLKEELMMLYSTQTGGGLSDNPAKAKMLRKQVARILTVKKWYENQSEICNLS